MNPEQVGRYVEAIRERHPMIHNITNFVVMNTTANALLAVGAAPVMAHAAEEAAEMTALADALVLNIGTLAPDWVESMLLAGKAAARKGIPIVLDPVGAGATHLRSAAAQRLLGELPVTVVRSWRWPAASRRPAASTRPTPPPTRSRPRTSWPRGTAPWSRSPAPPTMSPTATASWPWTTATRS
jgi:hypothetical protein